MRLFTALTLAISALSLQSAIGQGFEGSIYFTKSNMLDVTQYAYHVKGNMVRIDEMVDGKDEMVAALLVNLETGEMIALSHERNLWMKRPGGTDKLETVKGEVIKGELKRNIHGKNCAQYRVKNKEADREIMYWVTDGNYAFFPKLLEILKRKDNFATYYFNLPDLDKKLPLLAEENTMLRDKKGFLQVDRIEEKKLSDSMFQIPAGFEKVER